LAETAIRIQRLAATSHDAEFNIALATDVEKSILTPILDLFTAHISEIDHLFPLITPMVTYFEKVLIMDPDEFIKQNRIGLLRTLDQKFSAVGEFGKLVI